jgi:hypothetical protein
MNGIERFQTLHLVDIERSFFMDFLLTFRKVLILSQFSWIDCHFDDLTIGLELFEDINIDITSIIDICIVLVELGLFPLTKQDFIVESRLCRHSVISLLYRLPPVFWQGIVCKIYDFRRELMRSESVWLLRLIHIAVWIDLLFREF